MTEYPGNSLEYLPLYHRYMCMLLYKIYNHWEELINYIYYYFHVLYMAGGG